MGRVGRFSPFSWLIFGLFFNFFLADFFQISHRFREKKDKRSVWGIQNFPFWNEERAFRSYQEFPFHILVWLIFKVFFSNSWWLMSFHVCGILGWFWNVFFKELIEQIADGGVSKWYGFFGWFSDKNGFLQWSYPNSWFRKGSYGWVVVDFPCAKTRSADWENRDGSLPEGIPRNFSHLDRLWYK